TSPLPVRAFASRLPSVPLLLPPPAPSRSRSLRSAVSDMRLPLHTARIPPASVPSAPNGTRAIHATAAPPLLLARTSPPFPPFLHLLPRSLLPSTRSLARSIPAHRSRPSP